MTASSAAPRKARRASAFRRYDVPLRLRLEFLLDAAILICFLLAYSLQFTGLPIHEWIGLGVGLVLSIHLTLHWAWVVRTTRQLLVRRGRGRLVWLVDLLLLFCMTLCVTSGILISTVALPELGISPGGGGFWSGLHSFTARLTLVLVAVHVALSWRWILAVGRRIAVGPRTGAPR